MKNLRYVWQIQVDMLENDCSSGAPNENIAQNYLNMALLNVF